jgi:HSP90 family molecular chaperone
MTTNVIQDLGLLPLEVAHTSFLLERLGQDCEPLQYLRELTQNSLEAVVRTGQPGHILWRAAPTSFPSGKSGLKLSITDSGDGMSASDLESHINRLSSSGAQQAHDGN